MRELLEFLEKYEVEMKFLGLAKDGVPEYKITVKEKEKKEKDEERVEQKALEN